MDTPKKTKSISTLFLLYSLVTIAFTLLYSVTFAELARYKGDEYVYYFGILTGVTYLFFFILHFMIAKINIANVLFTPLVILFLGISIGMAVLLWTNLEATTIQSFYLHTFLHILFSFLFVKMLWRKYFKDPKGLRTTQASQNTG